MKHEISKIYTELAAGKLSQQEALAKIKALQQPASKQAVGTLLAATTWSSTPVVAGAAATFAQRHIMLCDLAPGATSELAGLIPNAHWATHQTSGSLATRYASIALAFFAKIQSILVAKPVARTLVQLVIEEHDGAQVFAGLAGLIATAALENPEIIGQIIFVSPGVTSALLAQRLQADAQNIDDSVLRYQGETRLVRRWQPIAVPTQDVQMAFKEHGVYLITGGLGGLGILLTQEILQQTTAAKIVLTGRGAAAGAKLATLQTLQQSGRVVYRQVDVGNADEVAQCLASITTEYGQLNGIFHSAGLVRDDFILKKSAEQFSQVLQPKVMGSEHLDLASQALELDFFVLFSSIAAWAGNVGQADYVCANGFMDQFASYRNDLVVAGKRKGKTLSIAWPHWLDGGMNIDAASMAQLEKRTGMRSLPSKEGMAALQQCLALPYGHLMVMHGDLAEMQRALEPKRFIKPAAAVAQSATPTPAMPATPATPAIQGNVADLSSKTREFLRKEFASVLKIPENRIETRVALEKYGIDSILAMRLTSQLEATFGTLPKTLFFEYQTINDLADYFIRSHVNKLNGLFASASAGSVPAAPVPVASAPVLPPAALGRTGGRRGQRFLPAPLPAGVAPLANASPSVAALANASLASAINEPIAIVGLSGRYPESPDLETFWRNLRDGKDCIVEIPLQRWDWRQYYSEDKTKEGAHFSKWGGFIEGVDEFDPRFFNIAPREARTIDPQERLFLQFAWMAIEDAGYTRASLQIPHEGGLAGQVGVYAGVMYGEYNLSGSLASIANRVSYFLNLHGPSITLDTMCSSSLTAIHLACQDLRLGRTSLALAGGVNVSVNPNKYTMLSGGQFISTDGHCQSFGEGGDGYIPGEGVGVAVLKRLSDAERDGNHIYGVIRGSALNHGGKTNGYTVPSPQAQAEVIRRALLEAKIDPRHVSYIEAHGTGTKLGDPIEIAALTKAFRESTQATSGEMGFCRIGSAKSNIGHCESAAGIAGVSKVVLQMRHAVIVPSLHSKKLNPHIDFASTPFVVNQSLHNWDRPVINGQAVPRIAGVSSFGAGGANAHVIIEEYRAVLPPVAVECGQVIVPLSARTSEQLQQKVSDLAAFIAAHENIDLLSLTHTLQLGREAMEERAAFLTGSIDDLRAKLQAFLKGENKLDTIYRAQVKQHKDAIAGLDDDPSFQNTLEQWLTAKELTKLADIWVKGLEFDWRKLMPSLPTPRLISLPCYPFAKERYWLDKPAQTAPAPVEQKPQVLHRFVHTNTSSLQQQSYATCFNGDESFLVEKSGQKFLPKPIALEMMQVAVELAAPRQEEFCLWQIRETVWGEPLTIVSGRSFGIALFQREHDQIDVELFSGEGKDERIHCQSHAHFCPTTPTQNVTATATSVATASIAAPRAGLAAAPAMAREIVFAASSSHAPVATLEFAPVPKKPSIRLSASVELSAPSATPRVMVALPALSTQAYTPAAQAVRLFERADLARGVYVLELETALDAALESLHRALQRLSSEPAPKVLLLIGRHANAWQGDRNACNAAIKCGLFSTLLDLPCPVVAVLPGNASGAGLLLAAICDFVVCSADGQYGFTDIATGLFPSEAEQRFFHARLGAVVADDLLYRSTQSSGQQLLAKGWACRVAPAAQVELDAKRFASELASKPALALGLLKTHLSRHLAPLVAKLSVAETLPTTPRMAEQASQSTLLLKLGGNPGDDLKTLTAELRRAVERVGTALEYKTIIISSALDGFLPSDKEELDIADVLELKKLVRDCPLPVIAAFEANAEGHAWLFGLFCDAVVYNTTGRYTATALWNTPALARELAVLAAERFGLNFAQELCLSMSSHSGTNLRSRVGALLVAEASAVMPQALRLAAFWDAWPRATVCAWKAAQSAHLQAALDALPTVQDAAESAATSATVSVATNIPLHSSVVTLTAHPAGVALISMQERAEKNMFSEALVSGLKEAFAHIAANPQYKVLVLTGYDSYFATGGTMGTLLAIQQGQVQFTDEKAFQLAMECPLPVIAAIQGHGIGGGWSFGMFSDLVLLSAESRYLSPYMGYGFTPGAGSTLMFPAKIGIDLARETLLGAQEISGEELRQRAVPLLVLPRREVLTEALALATRVAQQPRARLIGLKNLWTHTLRQSRDDMYRREVEMHEKTFVNNTETLQAIQAKISKGSAQAQTVTMAAPAESAVSVTPVVPVAQAAKTERVAYSASSIIDKLRVMLAQELYIKPEEIDQDTQFIDLGLDSITGVTWIRKINVHYGTDIQATKVYSHPTLQQLSGLVADEANALRNQAQEAESEIVAPAPIIDAARVVNLAAPIALAALPAQGVSQASVIAKIKTLLAQELVIKPEEIDEDTQFIDLGLDSIIGVTWIRKINSHYGINIEATKVYSHPTLQLMADLVRQEAEKAGTLTLATPMPMPAPTPIDAARVVNLAAPIALVALPTQGVSQASVIAKIKTLLAQELVIKPEEIDEDTQFIDLGLDSIIGVTWIRKINSHYGINIEATKVYSHPTLQLMANLVRQEAEKAGTLTLATPMPMPAPTPILAVAMPAPALAPVSESAVAVAHGLVSWRGRRDTRITPRASAEPIPSVPVRRGSQPIAVIGMAGQFPQARNLSEYWANLAEGRNCITEISKARWSLAEYFIPGAPKPGKTNSKWLGAVEDYDLFDPLFFSISPTEAECMEPQQRLFLQACWHSIENAGYSPQSLSSSQCGVFVGCGPSEYHHISREHQLSAQGFIGATSSILAARISYFLNLRGPSIALETACSSSLVAISSACDSLNFGDSDLALAGGVYVMAGPNMHIMSAQAGMLSTDGRCHTFDQRANGFVPGEAVGVLLLKRLDDAERDHDRIDAVIEAWGVNQDGKTNGITAPNEEAQTRLLQAIYKKFAIDPASISLIEAHGTGTKLGDPIEIAGLKAAFKPFTNNIAYCALGSVKSNIGHCLTAAGATGMIKLILALKHRTLPPTINYQNRNEHIQLDGSPFYINDKLQAWIVAAGQSRRAAISSFGFSGTNAHIVVAEHRASAETRQPVAALTQDGKMPVPLSARSEAQLRQIAQELLAFIRTQQTPPDLLDLAYTLQVGRDKMGERLGFLVGSIDELCSKLNAYLAGDSELDEVYQGQVKRNKEGLKLLVQDNEIKAMIVEKWLTEKKLGKLLDLWVKGLDLDWTRLYGTSKPRRIALPNYPFAKERYWLTAQEAPVSAPRRAFAAPKALRAALTTGVRRAQPVLHDKLSYVPDWQEQALPSHSVLPVHKTVLIVRTAACFGLENAILGHYAQHGGHVILITLGDASHALSANEWVCGVDDADGYRTCLQESAQIDALYFLASNEQPADPASLDMVKNSQESNEIQLLRLVKYLKQSAKIGDKIDTYLLTVDNYPLGRGANRYWGAGASGLGYSLAQGNHQFRVRNLDLSTQDGLLPASTLIAAIIGEPASNRGEVFKLQHGKRYRQAFFRLAWDKAAPSAIKQDGVYLIVGGSGIVGQVVTRNLIEKYRANVVWLGRSPIDETKIQNSLKDFAKYGDKLQYIQADVVSEEALRKALASIKAKHQQLHGAIFCGMVFGVENSIDQTSEQQFRDILQVKTLGSQSFYAALRDEPLDFMCFFSSGQAYSFSGAAKASAYSTGICFGDSFARAIRAVSRFPVGIINWGFWMAAMRERIEKIDSVSTKSIGAIEDHEGFECFERFVGELQRGSLSQVLCMRASDGVETLMNCNQKEFISLEQGNGVTRVSFTSDNIEQGEAQVEQLARAPRVGARKAPAALQNVPQLVRTRLLACLSSTLKIASDSIDTELAFSDYGIDSILGIKFIDQINESLGLTLNTAIIFEYANIERLSRHIVDTNSNEIEAKRSLMEQETEVLDDAEPDDTEPAPRPAPRQQRVAQLKKSAPRVAKSEQDVASYVRNNILDCLSATLKIGIDSIDTELAFSDYGIDSILGVKLIDQINERLGIALNTAIIFEYPSIERLSGYVVQTSAARIAEQLNGQDQADVFDQADDESLLLELDEFEAELDEAPETPMRHGTGSDEIAIIGISGQFPKANNVEQFWTNLIAGVDGVEELPSNYLDQSVAYSPVKQKGKSRCKWAGILVDRDCFDPLFFSISPKEAESMNPHQRLVMQESWNAIEDAGYNPKSLSGSQTAIFIGAEPSGYMGESFTGLSDAIVASRLSYALNFKGSAFVVNTGCSSSAVATHLGCESLRSGESDLVLAGGVNACLHQDLMVCMDQIDMLSPTGRCFTFDKAGDGTIISEGVAIMALKRLADAVAAGDHIYATICASGMNQDGASNGITAPNGAAQEELIVGVYERFGIDAKQISYVEAHGTGTKLGDPVETNALVRAFRKYGSNNNWCAIGSAKSHIGHTAAAAGAIGIIKVLLSMEHQQLPKLLNFKNMNPLIQFETSPFYITTKTAAWTSVPGVPRMAAINSFGHSGTNAHLVLKEHFPHQSARPVLRSDSDIAIPISAKTSEQLQQKAEDLLRFIRAGTGKLDLHSLAYTLQVGRESMDERLGLVVSSFDMLIEKLAAYLAGDAQTAGVFRGQAKRNGETIVPDAKPSASSLLALWTQGRNLDWNLLWNARTKPTRMRLPGYPFAKERYWMANAFGVKKAAANNAAASEALEIVDGMAIEDIINRIDNDSLGTDEGVALLKAIV